MSKCLMCGTEGLKPNHGYDNWTSCSKCGNDGDVANGVIVPYPRRYVLCSVYNNVKNFDSSKFDNEDTLIIKSKRGKLRECVVIAIHRGDNLMVIQEELTGEHFYICNYWDAECAYDAMFPSYRRTYAGWKHKTMKIVR